MNKSNSKTWKEWAIRKIRNSRVRYHGHWYYADETYDGSLDGTWMVFYSYVSYWDNEVTRFAPYICPWGTLEYFNEKDEERKRQLFRDSPLWHPETRHDRWHIWYPKREDALVIINAEPSRSFQHEYAIDVKDILLPGLEREKQWDAINWYFRDVFPAYNSVHTNPERYKDVAQIEGLK